MSPTTIHDDRVHKRDSPKRTEKKSLPPTPKGKAKKASPDTKLNSKAIATPSKDISRAPTAESTESTNSADPATNSTPKPRAPSERKQSKRSCSSSDVFDPIDCSKNGGEWHNQWWMCGFGETIRDVLKGSELGKKAAGGRSSTSRSESPKATEVSKAKRGEC